MSHSLVIERLYVYDFEELDTLVQQSQTSLVLTLAPGEMGRVRREKMTEVFYTLLNTRDSPQKRICSMRSRSNLTWSC